MRLLSQPAIMGTTKEMTMMSEINNTTESGIQNLEELARWFLDWAKANGYTEEEAVALSELESIEL